MEDVLHLETEAVEVVGSVFWVVGKGVGRGEGGGGEGRGGRGLSLCVVFGIVF